MNPIPKYPLDTAAKLALIRAGGWYYDTHTKSLHSARNRVAEDYRDAAHPLNAAFHFFIQNSGKKPIDWGEFGSGVMSSVRYKALNRYQFGIGDQRAVYGTT